jgi:hypothetical protein
LINGTAEGAMTKTASFRLASRATLTSILLFVELGCGQPSEPAASPRKAAAQVEAIPAEPREFADLAISIPGSNLALPEWVDAQASRAPFDVRAFLDSRKPTGGEVERLYLLGLAHLSADVAFGLSGRHQKAAAARAIAHRKEVDELYGIDNPDEVAVERRDGFLAECQPGVQRLEQAQALASECTFSLGFQPDQLLPHAQAARPWWMLTALQIRSSSSAGDFESIARALRRQFRLSRDLRPRGGLICQFVSVAGDAVVLDELRVRVLGNRDLTPSQCDELLKLLREHAAGRDLMSEAVRVEYITLGCTLHAMENGKLPATDPRFSKLPSGFASKLVFAQEWSAAKDLYATALASLDTPYHQILKHDPLATRAQEMLKGAKVNAGNPLALLSGDGAAVAVLLLPALSQGRDAEARHLVRLRATQALVAIRRYHLTQGRWPDSLKIAMDDVGIDSLPTDPFSGEPLGYRLKNGLPLVYSVGSDQRDDSGEEDWKFGKQRGDFLFPLVLTQRKQVSQ